MVEYLVTGATGFIGQHLVVRLQGCGHNVRGVGGRNGDVALASTWKSFPKTNVVVHLASRTFVPDSWDDPVGFVQTNVCGTLNALEYCMRHDAQLIFLSSYLYGTSPLLPVSEHAPLAPTNPYALSKKLAEDTCQFYANSREVSVTVLRPFNIYGPQQSNRFLIPELIEQLHRCSEITVNDLSPKRDYLFIDDLIDAIISAADRQKGYQVFNIGSGKSYSVAEIIQVIKDVSGSTMPVKSQNTPRSNELMDTRADITAAHDALGWAPRVDIKEGIRRTLQFRDVSSVQNG